MNTFNSEKLAEIHIQLWYLRNTAFETSVGFNPSKMKEGSVELPMNENKTEDPLIIKSSPRSNG